VTGVQTCALPICSLTVILSRESDSRWHARGDVIDLRKHSFVPLVDDIQPAGVIHMMSIDLDFDPELANKLLDEIGLDQRDERGIRLRPDGAILRVHCRAHIKIGN